MTKLLISGMDGAGQRLPQAQLDHFLSLVLSRAPEFVGRVAGGLWMTIYRNDDIRMPRITFDDPSRRGDENVQAMLNTSALIAFGFPFVEPLRISIDLATGASTKSTPMNYHPDS